MCKPKERLIVTSIMIFITLMITSNVFAAERRLYENFDDQAIDPLLRTRIYGGFNVTQPTYSFGTGHGGSGYSFGSGTTNATWLEWNFANTWYTDELYVSFWMRYPTFTQNYSNENIKFFYPQFGTSNSDKVEYLMYNGNNSGFYCGYNNNAYLGSAYLTLPNQADGNWHRYEFYIRFSTGTHKFWYDRPMGNFTDGAYLKNSVNYGSGVWDNHINIITFGSIDGEQPSTFTRFFDDVEVWDGMPDSEAINDTIPPYVSSLSPGANTTNVAINANIVAHLLDSGDGVNSSSITMTVNNQTVSPVITGSASDYTLTYNPPADLSYNGVYSVTITARDLAGNVMTPYTYSFTTRAAPDTTPPAAPIGVSTTIIQ